MTDKQLQDLIDELFLALIEMDDTVSDMNQDLKGAYDRIKTEHSPNPDSDIGVDEWERILLEGEMEVLEYRRLRNVIETKFIKILEGLTK